VKDKEQTIRQMLDREKVAAHDAFYVGDTSDDIAHGRQAKVVTFGYMKGYNSPDRIREAKPKYMVESLLDMLSIVRANIN
jgi:phosphoglycolate phosphatase-like HAD superfamily hydrolase